MSTTGQEIDPNGVNHPKGYNMHPSGVECIEIIRYMLFDTGCVYKYLFRYTHKDGAKDLAKAKWYINDFIKNAQFLDRRPSSIVLGKMLKVFNAETNLDLKVVWGAFYKYMENPRSCRLAELEKAVSRI